MLTLCRGRVVTCVLQATIMGRSPVRAAKGSLSERFRITRHLCVDTTKFVSSDWQTARSVLHVGLPDVVKLA